MNNLLPAIALDVGDARIGFAVCDTQGRFAFGRGYHTRSHLEHDIHAIQAFVTAENAKAAGLTTPNAEALKQGLIDKALSDDKTIYVDVAGMGAALEYLKKGDPKVDELYQRAFDEIKAA